MQNISVLIARATSANLMENISPKHNPEHLLRETSSSFVTIENRRVASDGFQADEQEPATSTVESWECSKVKMTHLPKDIDISKKFYGSEYDVLEEPAGASVTLSKANIQAAIKHKVYSAVWNANREVPQGPSTNLWEIISRGLWSGRRNCAALVLSFRAIWVDAFGSSGYAGFHLRTGFRQMSALQRVHGYVGSTYSQRRTVHETDHELVLRSYDCNSQK